jgi:hypothetical protein
VSDEDKPESGPEHELRPPERVAYMRGQRAAATSIISHCLGELGYRYSQGEFISLASAVVEREAVLATLREVCEKHGDNDWDEPLHLSDIIDKHLRSHLESQWSDRAALIPRATTCTEKTLASRPASSVGRERTTMTPSPTIRKGGRPPRRGGGTLPKVLSMQTGTL